MQTVPLFIYSGYITKEEALYKIGVQLIWIAVLYATGKLLMRNSLKKVIVQGG
jgi:ABC-type uncharacterized transport system permease subunit